MKLMIFGLALLASTWPAEAGAGWSKLWHNADQRGEALLQHGDAAAAAKAYHDPRRKAYAELKAGAYAAAAHDLAAFDDVDAHYNRGNALAHAGDLQGAIRAYDAALKHDPHNQDAHHNRELVAKALKQKAQQQSAGKNAQDEKQKGKDGGQGSPSPSQGKQGERSKPDSNSNSEKQPQSSAGNSPQQAKKHAGAEPRPSAQNTTGKENAQQGLPQTQGKPGTTQQATSNPQSKQSDEAEQAKRDAATSLAKPSQAQEGQAKPSSTNTGDALGGGKPQAASSPPSEQQLAQDQWLRGIPDDPGGLLRRKFLIEHIMRHQ